MDNRGAKNPNWKGGIYITRWGYRYIYNPNHPRADKRGYVNEGILVAEKALGKPLPLKAVVHHHNKNKLDNHTPGNLVVCQDQAYHLFLHLRERSLKACGNPNYRKCKYCKRYDSQINLKNWKSTFYHQNCANKYIYSLKHKEK